MKNRQHKYILKVFCKSSIPAAVRRDAPELIAPDSLTGGYCTQVLNGAKEVEFKSDELISKSQKAAFSDLINRSHEAEKDDLIVYNRLAILTEEILLKYCKQR